jgi:hypothetical protein
MLRLLSLICLAFVVGFLAVKDASAAVADNGPPYTEAQFLEISKDRLPIEFRRNLNDWWAKAPDYLRKRILNAPSQMWWHIILCNYMGFKPAGMPPGGADKCEQDSYRASQRGRNNWNEKGEWVGPSEECKKRDKRTEWGELICD